MSARSVDGRVGERLEDGLECADELVVREELLGRDLAEEVLREVDDVGLARQGRLGDELDDEVAELLRERLDTCDTLGDVLNLEPL